MTALRRLNEERKLFLSTKDEGLILNTSVLEEETIIKNCMEEMSKETGKGTRRLIDSFEVSDEYNATEGTTDDREN